MFVTKIKVSILDLLSDFPHFNPSNEQKEKILDILADITTEKILNGCECPRCGEILGHNYCVGYDYEYWDFWCSCGYRRREDCCARKMFDKYSLRTILNLMRKENISVNDIDLSKVDARWLVADRLFKEIETYAEVIAKLKKFDLFEQ